MLKHLQGYSTVVKPSVILRDIPDVEKFNQQFMKRQKLLRLAALENQDRRGRFSWQGFSLQPVKPRPQSTVPDQFVPYAIDWLP